MSEDARPPSIDVLHHALTHGTRYEKLDALEASYKLGKEAAPLIPAIADLLTSEDYVPCTALETEAFGHAVLAERARSILEGLQMVPDLDQMRRLLSDRRVYLLPEASYDQGAYIGDYSSETVCPAGITARLVRWVMGQEGFDLLPELVANAIDENDEIGGPARLAIENLAKIVSAASLERRAAFGAAIERITAEPQVWEPTTRRGLDLRDLAAFGRKKLAAPRTI